MTSSLSRVIARGHLILLVLMITSCAEHSLLGPGVQSVIVHAVLNPAEGRQLVVLRRASTVGRGGLERPVQGAKVSLILPDGSPIAAVERGTLVVPASQPDSSGFYLITSGALVGGATYRLHIEAVTGERIDATTTIPIAPTSLTLAPSAMTRATDTLRLVWPRAAGARAYEVRVFERGQTTSGFVSYSADTSVALAGIVPTGSAAPFPRIGIYDVVVAAVDENYYQYYRLTTDPFTGTALPMAIQGGLGVFGAYVPIRMVAIGVR